jgi:peroxiredoxin
VQVSASLDSLPYTLNINGSEVSAQMAQLRASARTATRDVLREQTQKIILANPRSLVAYYALFLKQNGLPIWDMADPSDRRLFQAVATSYNLWMPEYNRTKALYNQVLEYMQAERSLRNQLAAQQLIAESENAFLDITLADAKGQMQSLSQYRGKVIVLDFSSTEMEQYVAYNFELRELYNQYHKQGLEIYSVSIDRNQLAWEDATEHLPWTIVRAYENDAVQVLTQYNVQSLPTLYLFDREGNVQGRYTDFKSLETDIAKYL